MHNTSHYKNWYKIEPVNKGWSADKKYYIETKYNNKQLLRVSDFSEYDRKKVEFDAVKRLDTYDILISRPLDFGICNEGNSVYELMTWIEGEDAEKVLPTLSAKEQYALGIKAGEILKVIHSVPAPENVEPWGKRFNKKIDNKIEKYRNCNIKVPGDDKILQYIEDNRYLLEGRPQCFQHGDYHAGNMVITPKGELGVIDFNRLDYGDPWEEFNRIVWCLNVSKPFASGRINGYFGDEEVPDKFFRLMALYISSNLLSSISWAIPFGQEEVDCMLKQISDMIEYYDGMTNIIPKWYLRNITDGVRP